MRAFRARLRAFALTRARAHTQAPLPPGKLRKKTVYFLKVSPGPLPKEDFEKKVVHGDLGEAALEQLSLLAQEVFIPLLCNPHNQAGWPEMVTREVMDNMYKFSASACVTVGLAKGQTVLPVPPVGKTKTPKSWLGSAKSSYDGDTRGVRPSADVSTRPSGIAGLVPAVTQQAHHNAVLHKFSTTAALSHAATLLGHHAAAPASAGGAAPISQHDLDMIHVVESAVVLWTHQIKNVLRTEPDQARSGRAASVCALRSPLTPLSHRRRSRTAATPAR
jgi:hypothetical protein